MRIFLVLTGYMVLIAIPYQAIAQWHSIPPVLIDLSPAWGIPPDGIPDYWCNAELDTPDLSASRLLTYPITEYGYHVTVSNLLPDPLIDASLIVQNLWEYCYSTLPPGFIHPDDIVWNPGAIANGSIPAYDLGIIPPNGSGSVDVVMLRGFEIPNQPAFQVLIAIPEPSTLVLLGIGVIGLLTYAWRWRKQTA